MKSQYLDRFICLQQINNKQWIVVFKRNNLSRQLFNFDTENNYYWYEETFNNTNSYVSLKLTIKSSVFYDIFYANCKYFKAVGGNNSFGISIKSKAFAVDEIMYKTLSKKVSEDTEFVKYQCSFKGTFFIYQLFDKKWNKIDKTIVYNKYKKDKMKRKPKAKHQNKTIENIPYEKIRNPKIIIDINVVKNCLYFKNKICIYFNDLCNPYSVRCKNPNILLTKNNKDTNLKVNRITQNDNKQVTTKTQYVKAIVLFHNRKCVYEEHNITNIEAIIKL